MVKPIKAQLAIAIVPLRIDASVRLFVCRQNPYIKMRFCQKLNNGLVSIDDL